MKGDVVDVTETLHRFDYAVKRVRMVGGQGKVFIYKYRDDVPIVQREYTTFNYSDMKLYDTFSLMLDDSKSGDEFELLLEGVCLMRPDGALSVYDLTSISGNIHAVREGTR